MSVYSNIAKVQTLQEVLIQELVVKIQYLILIRQHLILYLSGSFDPRIGCENTVPYSYKIALNTVSS